MSKYNMQCESYHFNAHRILSRNVTFVEHRTQVEHEGRVLFSRSIE